MTDDENIELDREILDQERAEYLGQMADDALRELDWQRQEAMQRLEDEIERQMWDLERELRFPFSQE